MKKWFQKTIAITVAFLTFGVITPDHEIWAAFDSDELNARPVIYERTTNDITETYQLDELIVDEEIDPVSLLINEAKNQSYIKFGTKIAPVIANEFDEIIFPKMSEAIEMQAQKLGSNLNITQMPSGGYKEKIFNVVNAETGKDVMRFHVRIENRPFEGHYYNFHYHLEEDKFTKHYDLGEIFWSKNQPPQWLS